MDASPAATPAPNAAPENAPADAQSSDGGAAPATPAAPAKSFDEMLKEGLEFKAKGRTVKVNTLEQLRHYAQKGFGSDVAFEERNQYEQKLQALESAFKDPKTLRKLLSERGLNPTQLGEEWVYEQIEAEKLTPEQQKLRELETWKAERERADAEAKQKQAEAEEAEQVKALQDRLSGVYLEALQAASIPREVAPWFIPRIAKLADQALDAGYEPEPAALAQMAIQDFRQEQAALISPLDGASLVSLLGEDVVNKIRRHDLQRLRERTGQRAPTIQTNPLRDASAERPPRPADPWSEIERKLKEAS